MSSSTKGVGITHSSYSPYHLRGFKRFYQTGSVIRGLGARDVADSLGEPTRTGTPRLVGVSVVSA